MFDIIWLAYAVTFALGTFYVYAMALVYLLIRDNLRVWREERTARKELAATAAIREGIHPPVIVSERGHERKQVEQ